MESTTSSNITVASTKLKRKKREKNNTTDNLNRGFSNNNPFLMAIEQCSNPVYKRTLQSPKQIFVDTSLLGIHSDPKMLSIYNVVEYQTLDKYTQKFRELSALFPPTLTILKIQQVFNPFLRLSFQLKRQFKYCNINAIKLFHGTKLNYVHSICTYNFNWRFNGAERGHRIGRGINFTPKPKFAMHFCEKNVDVKVMILADVLIINKGVGHKNLEVPPEGCDTAVREDNKTFVKFNDGEFYPSYVIFVRKV